MDKKKLLLVDANIISHALTTTQTPSYVRLFEDLEKNYRFVVTGYTKFELMCSSDKQHRNKIEEYLDNDMSYVVLSKELMDFSARLCFLYSQHASTKGKQISKGDIVNAAFAIAKPCDLLTIDNNDYPTPFFEEVKRERITYKSKKGNDQIDTVHILRPDLKNIKECFKRYDV